MNRPEAKDDDIASGPRGVDAPVFAPGFRMSMLDAAFLLVMATAATVAFASGSSLAWIIVSPTAQFFLFCNVFRIRRAPELMWAGAYAVTVVGVVAAEVPDWVAAIIGSVLGALLIAHDMRHPSYHGVLWRRLNPGAEAWFRNRIASRTQ